FERLSGSAVAFKLAWTLCQKACGSEKVTPRFREYLLDAGALGTLGIVAGVGPGEEENRIRVRHGPTRLRRDRSPLRRAVLAAGRGGEGGDVGGAHVGDGVGPVLNAAGRLGCARLVVELLTTASGQRALDLARYLLTQNQDRQKLERRILAEARAQVEGTAQE